MEDQIDVEKKQQEDRTREKLEILKGRLLTRQQAYAEVFEIDKPGHILVLKDLARFCRAHETTFNPDPMLSKMLEGRREVWLRIQKHLNLPNDVLWKLFNNGG